MPVCNKQQLVYYATHANLAVITQSIHASKAKHNDFFALRLLLIP